MLKLHSHEMVASLSEWKMIVVGDVFAETVEFHHDRVAAVMSAAVHGSLFRTLDSVWL